MARRASKAANRRARQQKRATQQRSAPAPQPASAPESAAAEAMVVDAPTSSPSARSEAPRRARPSSANMTLSGSTLSASERSEYHYVERDLRNIGILSLVMVGLLALAWFIFTATGLIG
jgi:hypothetical protein